MSTPALLPEKYLKSFEEAPIHPTGFVTGLVPRHTPSNRSCFDAVTAGLRFSSTHDLYTVHGLYTLSLSLSFLEFFQFSEQIDFVCTSALTCLLAETTDAHQELHLSPIRHTL